MADDLLGHFEASDDGYKRVYYHGTPDERSWDHSSSYGIHVGSYKAARQALEARIGAPAEGEWDGTREYGKTPIVSNAKNNGYASGLSAGGEPRHEDATYSDGERVPLDARPSIFPVHITGPMTNHPAIPVEDAYANGRMRAQLTRGNARRGYYYRNAGEDEGSISAVVPSAAHLERVHEPHTAAQADDLIGHFQPTAEPGPVYYHGSGRTTGRALTGNDDWDNAGLFVSHNPKVARDYGPDVERIEMSPDTRVVRHEGMSDLPGYARKVQDARNAGADVVEFHRPHDFVGHVILNQGKIISRQPHPVACMHSKCPPEECRWGQVESQQHEAAAEPEHETWYHLTDNPRFALDPEHEPQDNALSIYPRTGKGIYLTKSPETWVNGHDYVRPYAAEFHAHPSIREHDTNGRWGGEMYVPAEHYDKLHLNRVIPLDAHVRETYGGHGWIEEHHGSEFDTGEPLRQNPKNRHYPFKPGWNEPSAYRYPGPDVRDMPAEEHARHRDRWLAYMKENRGFDDEDVAGLRQQHDSHRTAAARPGRGEERCGCCDGTGTHRDGSSCTRCEGSGAAPRGTRDPNCPDQPAPKRRHWREGAVHDYDPDDDLPEGRGVFYRAHIKGQPLDEAHARSAPRRNLWGSDSGLLGPGQSGGKDKVNANIGLPGYSAFASPHHLSIYMHAAGWSDRPEQTAFGDRDVIAFHGKQVGRGEDNEPLVMPEADRHCCGRVIHSRTPWDEFENRIWSRVGVTLEDRADPFFFSNQRKEISRQVPWSYTRGQNSPEMRSVRRNQEKEERRHQREGAMADKDAEELLAHFAAMTHNGMAWMNQDSKDKRKYTPISVRHAGFAGLVGDQDWEDEMREERGDPEEHFDEDLYDESTPEPTHEEQAHYEEHGDYPDSYHERRDQAYEEAVARKQSEREHEDALDHDDPDMMRFVRNHGSNTELWHRHGTLGPVNLRQPVYATQSHVAKEHIQRYLDKPKDTSWHHQLYGPGTSDYLANEHPMFVTHEGRLHATDGHHRIAAGLVRGDEHIHGWHFDLDRHPEFADMDEDEMDDHLNHHEAALESPAPEPDAELLGHFEAVSGGMIDLYHHTTEEKAEQILASRSMHDQSGRPNGPLFFSNIPHGFYGGDYGPAAVHVRVPEHLATPDDSFRNGEKYYTVKASDLRPEHIIGKTPDPSLGHREAASPEEYGISHRPEPTGPPLHDLTEGDMMPRDIYERLHEYNLYSHDNGPLGEAAYQAQRKIRLFRGKPDKMVTIWRSAPAVNPESRNGKRGEINNGDWVGLSRHKALAESYEANDPPSGSLPGNHPDRYHIWSARVPAKHVRNADGDTAEWGYFGPDVKDIPHVSEQCSHRARVKPREAAMAKDGELSDEEIQKGLGLPTTPEERSREEGKELAHRLLGPLYEDDGSEENYRLHRQNEYGSNLQRRYPPGGQGKHGFDEDGDPHYDLEHRDAAGRPTGWYARAYDGPEIDIRHRATGGDVHDVMDVADREGRLPERFGEEHLRGVLNEWHGDVGAGVREHLEQNDPKIMRWRQRHSGSLQSEAARELIEHFGEGGDAQGGEQPDPKPGRREAAFEYPLAPGHLGEQGYRITDESRGYIAGGPHWGGGTTPEQSWGSLHMQHPGGEIHGSLDYGQVGRDGDPHHEVNVEDLRTAEGHTGNGIASALMDHLYAGHPEPATVSHSLRTDEGGGWWGKYISQRPHIAEREERQRAAEEAEAAQPWWYKSGDEYDDMLHEAAHEPEGAEAAEPDYGEWPEYLRKLRYRKKKEPEMHRGMAVELPPDVHAMVTDRFQGPPDRQARAIVEHLKTQPLGMHWSADPDVSREFAGWENKRQPGTMKVIVHAKLPELEHIETDPEKLREGAVFRHDNWMGGEKEIPLREGAPVRITGVTWYGYRNRKTRGNVYDTEHIAVRSVAAADPEPHEIARALDQFRDAEQAKHQDDLKYVPEWGPLHRTLPEGEHSGWMFMQRHDHPEHGELVTYKHGITRVNLTLDRQGQAFGRDRDRDDLWHGPFDPAAVLDHRGHYRDLASMGETPQTPYSDDYRARRNQALRDAGYNVVEGASAAEPRLEAEAAMEAPMQHEAAYVQMPEPDAEGRYKFVDHPGLETRDELIAHMKSDEHYGSYPGIDRWSEERLRELHEWDHRRLPGLHKNPAQWTSWDFMGHRYRQHKDDPEISPEDHALIHAMGFEGSEQHTHDVSRQAGRAEIGHMREASLQKLAALENPVTGGHEWFHGTQAHPEDLEHGFSDPMNDSDWNAWNATLGTHFTSDHELGRWFAQGEHHLNHDDDGYAFDDGPEEPNPSVVHARLHLRNPKIYASEHDMDNEAYEHEFAAGNHPSKDFPDDPDEREWDERERPGTYEIHREWGNDKIPADAMSPIRTRNAGHPVRQIWLTTHPDMHGIARRFRERLEAQGHDGIVYGNAWERGPKGVAAPSAIAFRPEQIEITQHHREDEPHPDVEHHLGALDVVAHFEALGAGPLFQQKLFDMKRDPTRNEPESGRHNPADPHAHLRWRSQNDPEYQPDTCEHCGHDLNLPEDHAEQHDDWLRSQDWYTDWNEEHPGDTLHRGIGADLPDEVHSLVHDQSRPVHERAHALMSHLLREQPGGNGLGNFWSSDKDVAKTYAESAGRRYGRNNQPTPVMFHAHTPDMEHIETDPETLQHWGVYSYHLAGNREVPISHGAPLRIKGISWAPPGHHEGDLSHHDPKWFGDGPHHLDQDPAWEHHEFGGEGIRATASGILEDGPREATALPSVVARSGEEGPRVEGNHEDMTDAELRVHMRQQHGFLDSPDDPDWLVEQTHRDEHTDAPLDHVHPDLEREHDLDLPLGDKDWLGSIGIEGSKADLPSAVAHFEEPVMAAHDESASLPYMPPPPEGELIQHIHDHHGLDARSADLYMNQRDRERWHDAEHRGRTNNTHQHERPLGTPGEQHWPDVFGLSEHTDFIGGQPAGSHFREMLGDPERSKPFQPLPQTESVLRRPEEAAALDVVAHFSDPDQYIAPPGTGEEMWRHLQEAHGVRGGAKTPGADFMSGLHDRFHRGQVADRRHIQHQHEEPGDRHDAGQSRDDSLSRMFTPIPAEELEERRRAYEPQPERLDDREYSIKDVSRHYDWEGFSPHEIEHLVHRPEHATFTKEDVPVHTLRYDSGDGNLRPIHTYSDIAGQDEHEQERLHELERGYEQGSNIPPIVVVRDGEHHIIADGSHRAAIHAEHGSTHIPAFVTQRTIFPEQHTAALEVTAMNDGDDLIAHFGALEVTAADDPESHLRVAHGYTDEDIAGLLDGAANDLAVRNRLDLAHRGDHASEGSDHTVHPHPPLTRDRRPDGGPPVLHHDALQVRMTEHRIRRGLPPRPTDEEIQARRAGDETRREQERADRAARHEETRRTRERWLRGNGFASEDEHEQFMGQMHREHDDIAGHYLRNHREEYDEGGEWTGNDAITREHLASDHMIPNPDARAASVEHGLGGLHWQHHVRNRENAHPEGLSGQWQPIPHTRTPEEQALMDQLGGGGQHSSGDAFAYRPRPEGDPIDPVFGVLQPAPDQHSAREERSDRWWNYQQQYSTDLHRGIHVELPGHLDEYVHDESVPREDRASALQQHFADSGEGLGMHWTPHVNIAHRAIWNAADEEPWRDDDDSWPPRQRSEPGAYTDVMFHVRKPGERNRLPAREHDQHEIGWNYSRDEDEFPLKPGSPLRLSGISWKRHEPEYPNEPYEHVDFPRPARHVSSRVSPPVAARTESLEVTAMDEDHGWYDADEEPSEESYERISPERDEDDFVWERRRGLDSGIIERDPDYEPRCLNCERDSGAEEHHMPGDGHNQATRERMDREAREQHEEDHPDEFSHRPRAPYVAPPQDIRQLREHMDTHHGAGGFLRTSRDDIVRGIHEKAHRLGEDHQHELPDIDPVFGSRQVQAAAGDEGAHDPGHHEFYSGHDRDNVEPRTHELEEHLRSGHAYGNWRMDDDLEHARDQAYGNDGDSTAARWRNYHINMSRLHQQAHERALDNARSAVEHGAPASHVEDTRRELESAHLPQLESEREEQRQHDEAVAEHREQGSVRMHGSTVDFGEMEAHLRDAHRFPHDAMPEYRLWSTPRHDPYERALEEAHDQAHGEMGSYRHGDEFQYAHMHGQPLSSWDAEHHLVQHHGFDLDDLRRDEPSLGDLERQHAENHERDRRYLTHHLSDEMDEDRHVPHHEWGDHDEEQYERTGQIPGYRHEQAQLDSYRHDPDYGETDAPSESGTDADTEARWRHQPYTAPPRSHEELWSHMQAQHGITQSGDSTKMPGQRFLHELHDKHHYGEYADLQRGEPHQHDSQEGHDPVFGARQAAAELLGHFSQGTGYVPADQMFSALEAAYHDADRPLWYRREERSRFVLERSMEERLRRQRTGTGWESEMVPNQHFVASPARPEGGVTHLMRTYMNGKPAGVISAGASNSMKAWKVHNMHVFPEFRDAGVAPAMMDSFYDHVKNLGGRWVDHGAMTHGDHELLGDYTEPHPEMNIHKARPAEINGGEGWNSYFPSSRVHRDMLANARNFPGTHPEPDWTSTDKTLRAVDSRWTKARGLPVSPRHGDWPEEPVNGVQEDLHTPGGWEQHARDALNDAHNTRRTDVQKDPFAWSGEASPGASHWLPPNVRRSQVTGSSEPAPPQLAYSPMTDQVTPDVTPLTGARELVASMASWQWGSATEAREVLAECQDLFRALREGLLTAASRFDECPVDEAVPDLFRRMSLHCLTAADDTSDLADRSWAQDLGRSTEGTWSEQDPGPKA